MLTAEDCPEKWRQPISEFLREYKRLELIREPFLSVEPDWDEERGECVEELPEREKVDWAKINRELWSWGWGRDLVRMAKVVEGEIEWSEKVAACVRDSVENLIGFTFDVPGLADEQGKVPVNIVPALWWESDIGRLCSWARLWADQDEALTLTEAAVYLKKPLSSVATLVDRGMLRAVISEDAPNPQHGRRLVSRVEVVELARLWSNK